MTFYGMMNIKNESEWIAQSLESLLTFCDFVFIIDDHSTDKTVSMCRAFGPRVRVYESPFSNDVDKTRDKNFIYDELLKHLPGPELNEHSPYWVAAFDGDEVLSPGAVEGIINTASEPRTSICSIAPQILYLWDDSYTVRCDGPYLKIFRPSVFRVINPAFRFNTTPFGHNLHCPNVPQELVGNHKKISGKVLHYGYLDRAHRLQKYLWNNLNDPGNVGEDYYRHTVIGDLPSLPASAVTKHAGPLLLRSLSEVL